MMKVRLMIITMKKRLTQQKNEKSLTYNNITSCHRPFGQCPASQEANFNDSAE